MLISEWSALIYDARVKDRLQNRRRSDRESKAREGIGSRERFKLAKSLESIIEERDRLRAELRRMETRYAALAKKLPSAVTIPGDGSDMAELGVRINRQALQNLIRQAERLGVPYQTFISEILHRYSE